MKIKGPIATLGAVAVLGTGLWLVNVNKQSEPAPQPAAATVTSAPATPPKPPVPPVPPEPAATPFAGREDFVANIGIKTGNLALEIRVTGDKALAYACDNEGIETWFSGSAVVGNLRIGEKSWDFTAVPGETSVF